MNTKIETKITAAAERLTRQGIHGVIIGGADGVVGWHNFGTDSSVAAHAILDYLIMMRKHSKSEWDNLIKVVERHATED